MRTNNEQIAEFKILDVVAHVVHPSRLSTNASRRIRLPILININGPEAVASRLNVYRFRQVIINGELGGCPASLFVWLQPIRCGFIAWPKCPDRFRDGGDRCARHLLRNVVGVCR